MSLRCEMMNWQNSNHIQLNSTSLKKINVNSEFFFFKSFYLHVHLFIQLIYLFYFFKSLNNSPIILIHKKTKRILKYITGDILSHIYKKNIRKIYRTTPFIMNFWTSLKNSWFYPYLFTFAVYTVDTVECSQ